MLLKDLISLEVWKDTAYESDVFVCLLHDRVMGPFFFHETTVKWNNYLDMLKNYTALQLLQTQEDWGFEITFQKDSAPPHWENNVKLYLNQAFPGEWLGRDVPTIQKS
jgi:hypothetical protein